MRAVAIILVNTMWAISIMKAVAGILVLSSL
jgi:hypothetical protein